jgi:hypothetical protein
LIKVTKTPTDSGQALVDQLFTAGRSGRCRYDSGRPSAMNQVAARVRCFCVSTSRPAELDLSLSAFALRA